MAGASDEHVASGLHRWGVRRVEKMQTVHVFEIKSQAALRSVNFKSVSIAAADSKAASFEAANAAVGKTRHEHDGVVHITAGNEGVSCGRKLVNFAVQVCGRIE